MFSKYRKFMKRNKMYRQTYQELNCLSNRELNDIGINRGDIPFISRNMADRCR